MRPRYCVLLLIAATGFLGAGNAPAAGSPRTHVVVIESMTFTPATVRVAPGDRVTFKNNDLVPHTATATGAASFDSGMIKPGASWTVTPPAGRPIDYVCSYHPAMKGRILSEEASNAKDR